jgi:ubiquinone/menaquinone biosynthesis C-methylase UbiE
MTSRPNIWLTPHDYDRHSELIQGRNADLLAGLALQYSNTYRSVLDLGCGTGAMLARVCRSAAFGRQVGLDISPEMLELARQRLRETAPDVNLRQGALLSG